MKRLIVCCDGTWQKLSSKYPTNVVKIAQAIKPLAQDKTAQIVFYDEGVGTGNQADKILGGALGKGIDQNIQDAYRFLCLNYDSGDQIYLYGFSRGAYTVRSLAGLIYCSGLLTRNKIRQIPEAYKLYRQRTSAKEISTLNTEEAINFRRENGERVPITFLGCWDTVGSLGIPDQIPWLPVDEWINKKYQFHNTSLSPIIKNACHAVAIDEKRKVFDVTPMIKSTKNPQQKLSQVWFPGGHGCVGGGTEEQSGLSDGALQWMIDESQTLGLEFDVSKVIDGINPDFTTAYNNRRRGIFLLTPPHLRTVDINNLHLSAIARWSKVDNYRPQNLAKYQALLNIKRDIYLAQHGNSNLSHAA